MGPLSIRTDRRFSTASPLRYPGGKASLTGFFAEIIENLGIQNARYVEPFAGGAGAALSLLRQGLVSDIVINDIDGAVYSFWSSVVNRTDEFLELLSAAPLTIEEWRRQRGIYKVADESDPLALGFAFFYLNRTNRSGVLNAGVIGGLAQEGKYRMDARFNRQELAARISAIGQMRDRIQVTDRDGGEVVRRYADDPEAFLYIDPPYVDMGGALYLNAFDHRDHADLARTVLSCSNAHWVLTYDNSDFIRKLYESRFLTEYELTYSAHRPGKATELLVASPSVARVLEERSRPEKAAG
jgi:DNA adenine methylase